MHSAGDDSLAMVSSFGLRVDPSVFLYCVTHTTLKVSALFLISHLHVPRSSLTLSQLKVGPVNGIPRDYMPGKSFSFQIQGDPGAKVSLVAVDNAVYLLRRDRLTQRKVCVMLTLEAVKATTDSQTSRFIDRGQMKIFTTVISVVLLIVCLEGSN